MISLATAMPWYVASWHCCSGRCTSAASVLLVSVVHHGLVTHFTGLTGQVCRPNGIVHHWQTWSGHNHLTAYKVLSPMHMLSHTQQFVIFLANLIINSLILTRQFGFWLFCLIECRPAKRETFRQTKQLIQLCSKLNVCFVSRLAIE